MNVFNLFAISLAASIVVAQVLVGFILTALLLAPQTTSKITHYIKGVLFRKKLNAGADPVVVDWSEKKDRAA